MDTRRLELLVDLSRLGSMREVAEARDLSTSAVSQQLAALSRDAGTALLEPVGRRVRLTPAGLRLADHAVRILSEADAAWRDLDPASEPAGTVRVGGFATAVRRSLLPALVDLRPIHPDLDVVISEHEPAETTAMLLDDDLDLGLTYDYDLAPAPLPTRLQAQPLWTAEWGLGVPAVAVRDQAGASTGAGAGAGAGAAVEVGVGVADLARWSSEGWIVNSRNAADEVAVRTLGNLHGFRPRITHSIDSLELVESLVLAGHGVGLLPRDRVTAPGVVVLPLGERAVVLTAYAVTRRGREQWSPLRTLVSHLHR